MADVRDWGKFIRGRWDWTAGGYERGFPRGCQFTDVDASIEFDGHHLVIEAKHYDGGGDWPGFPPNGQLAALRDEVRLGKSVLIIWGCGPCNSPWAICRLATSRSADRLVRWDLDLVPKPIGMRRGLLKAHIDDALGIFDLKGAT